MMRHGIDSDPWCAAERAGGVRPNASIIKVRIIINRHPTVFFRAEFIILRRIHLDFLRLVDEKPEIVPELVLVPDALRHNMTQLVERDESERILVDEFIPFFGCIHAKCELFALVLTICGVFARR
jgi:hypothetical protein